MSPHFTLSTAGYLHDRDRFGRRRPRQGKLSWNGQWDSGIELMLSRALVNCGHHRYLDLRIGPSSCFEEEGFSHVPAPVKPVSGSEGG